MQNSTYKIYNASAGSGKTFTLAKSYLKILVASNNLDQFKTILAITFTNKAVGEMKERIIDMLKLFSLEKSLSQPHPMFNAICEELSISPDYLNKKSKHLLKHIIHNYGAFDISTIDGFTHRVIRTFAYDLNLPINFEVELDQDKLLNEAVDSLIAKAGSNNTLTNVLINFAIEKADDDKSWDISCDFNKIAKLLVNENDYLAIQNLKDKSFEDFKALKVHLTQQIIGIENDIVKTAETTLTLIEECGLQYNAFNRKSLPNHFLKLCNKQFNVAFEAAWQNDLVEGNTLYPKRVSEVFAAIIEDIQLNLAEAFIKTKTLIFDLKLIKGFHKNITPLSVLNAIQKELDALKDGQNKMLISEFNKIISKEIKDQPTPFIYERLGEKFKYYFIDEFQDTSKMQWNNLIPLLDNALSASNGSVMLVGDAKQAIYRWRGGEAEQFIDLYNKTKNPFQIEPEVLSLDNNYRSAKEIIKFNNSFFEFLSNQYFSLEAYAELYQNAGQNTHSKEEGFVNLNFLDFQKEDNVSELYSQEVLETINQCVDKGYTLNDICVLVRKRKEGVAIANFLSKSGIKITSSETLLLKNSNKVVFITALLKLLLQPNNDTLKIEFLSYIADKLQIDDKHQFFIEHLKKGLDDMFAKLKELQIFINKDELLQKPLYELVEHIVRVFNLHDESDAYLQFYLDVVLEFTQKQNSDLAAFINYFETKQDNLSVVTPNNMNAVNIMTIHKSKGLEFPIVIFPFADLNIYKELEPKVWFPINEEDYCGFDTLLLDYKKDVEQFGETGAEIYKIHQAQLELDNINLLYVVLTRAVNQLFIITKKDIGSKEIVNPNTYSGMFISYLQHQGKWLDDKLTYSFGDLIQKEKSTVEEEASNALKFISVPKEAHNLSIITKAGLLWDTKQKAAMERGNLVHLVLSKIKTIEDIDFAISELLDSGDITNNNIETLKTLTLNVIKHPKLSLYFQDNFNIYNERDIITNSGQLIRPDRLNINSKNEVVIIDYKTGTQKSSHKSQINDYERIISLMNLTVVQKILVYINETIDVVEV